MEDRNQNGLMERFLRSGVGRISLLLLFAPFAIVYIYGFLFGDAPKMGKVFGVWFMASMTVAALVTTLDEASGIWRKNKRVEWGCLLPFALVTVWFGFVLLKEVGVVK